MSGHLKPETLRRIEQGRAQFLAPGVGDLVRFAPNPRIPTKMVEARVVRQRTDPRLPSLRSTEASRSGRMGWLDTIDEAGTERSVRPSRCTIVEKAKP